MGDSLDALRRTLEVKLLAAIVVAQNERKPFGTADVLDVITPAISAHVASAVAEALQDRADRPSASSSGDSSDNSHHSGRARGVAGGSDDGGPEHGRIAGGSFVPDSDADRAAAHDAGVLRHLASGAAHQGGGDGAGAGGGGDAGCADLTVRTLAPVTDAAPAAALPKVYIAGPMRGYPEHNYPAFNAAAARMRALGHEVVNPVEVNHIDDVHGTGNPAEFYVANDLLAMLGAGGVAPCTAIALLPGWQGSVGARCEVALAITLGYRFFDAEAGCETARPWGVTVDRGYAGSSGAEQSSLDALACQVQLWQANTFPKATPHSVATHLLEEAHELHDYPTDVEEIADVFMLCIGAARVNRVSLVDVVSAKLEKNKARTWGEPDADGVVKHVAVGGAK